MNRSYFFSVGTVCGVAAVCYPFTELIGYRVVALLLLLAVSVLAMNFQLRPVILAAVCSALIWDFFFIPPRFTLYIGQSEDALMLVMFFIVALLNGVLTARFRKFEELARQKEERANTIKLYDALFNSLSHELRTPIATIMGASENLMTENVRITEGVKGQLMRQINESAERLNRLVNNLLNMSRLDSGFIQPKLDWHDVNELIYTVVNRLEPESGDHPININIADGTPLVKLDFGLIDQALFNILYNALIYTPAGTTIKIQAFTENKNLIILIEDNGPGFPRDDVARVFEKFYRAKGSRSGGTGLGLSISKGFIEAHGGTIRVENERGGGAKFSIQIPTETNELSNTQDE